MPLPFITNPYFPPSGTMPGQQGPPPPAGGGLIQPPMTTPPGQQPAPPPGGGTTRPPHPQPPSSPLLQAIANSPFFKGGAAGGLGGLLSGQGNK